MSSKNNVNPDHYKTAGRQRQGENINQDIYKREYAQSKADSDAEANNFIPGARNPEPPRQMEEQVEDGERAEAGSGG